MKGQAKKRMVTEKRQKIGADLAREESESVPSPAWHAAVLGARERRIADGTARFLDIADAKQAVREQLKKESKSLFGHRKMTEDKWILVTEYPIAEYKCGLKAGDRVRLRKDLIVRDDRKRPTGDVHRKGEVWTVLRGSTEGRIDVWFRQADGKRHTWNDVTASIDEWFERLGNRKKVRTRRFQAIGGPRLPQPQP